MGSLGVRLFVGREGQFGIFGQRQVLCMLVDAVCDQVSVFVVLAMYLDGLR